MPGLSIAGPDPMLVEPNAVQELFALFLDGVAFLAAPNLVRPP